MGSIVRKDEGGESIILGGSTVMRTHQSEPGVITLRGCELTRESVELVVLHLQSWLEDGSFGGPRSNTLQVEDVE